MAVTFFSTTCLRYLIRADPFSSSHRRAPAAVISVRRCSPLVSARLDGDGVLTFVGEGLLKAIEELELMSREPADVLGEVSERLSLSPRELQLLLVYFAQDGRDPYCALEVFDWLHRSNRVDGETMALMVSIVCTWVEHLVAEESHEVADVVGLLNEMECVGIDPPFSMVEKVVSLYWEQGRRDRAIEFVKDVVRRRSVGKHEITDSGSDEKGGPVGYLAWKMMADGDYMGAINFIIELKSYGLNPDPYSYLIALTALVKEQKEFSKSLRLLSISLKSGLISNLDAQSQASLREYQLKLLRHGVQLSSWAISDAAPLVHERLFSLYACAGRGLEAEHHLWQMKISGREPDHQLYDIVLAICASQNEDGAVRRLLAGARNASATSRKRTLSWLVRGYVKGQLYLEAAEAVMEMMELGFHPEYLDRVVVMQGLRKGLWSTRDLEAYIKLCKQLSDHDLVGPCLVYMYLPKYRLWTVRML